MKVWQERTLAQVNPKLTQCFLAKLITKTAYLSLEITQIVHRVPLFNKATQQLHITRERSSPPPAEHCLHF